jgi:hypothetical protein
MWLPSNDQQSSEQRFNVHVTFGTKCRGYIVNAQSASINRFVQKEHEAQLMIVFNEFGDWD